MKTWKRRWFILTDNCLYYFEYTTVSVCIHGQHLSEFDAGAARFIWCIKQDVGSVFAAFVEVGNCCNVEMLRHCKVAGKQWQIMLCTCKEVWLLISKIRCILL